MDFFDLAKSEELRTVEMGKRIGEKTRENALVMIEESLRRNGYTREEHTQRVQWFALSDDNKRFPISTENRRNFVRTTYDYVPVTRIVTTPEWTENTTDDVFGGLSLINGRGKIAKRIRANLYKNYELKVPPQDLAKIGAYINNNASAMGKWHYKLTYNMAEYIGYFGDSGSCFSPGGMHQSHREAMEMDDRTAMVLIYDKDKKRYARAWVHYSYDNSLIFFNAYSLRYLGQLRTRQIASIVGSDLGLETRRIRYDTDIYKNTNWAIALGGDKEQTYYEFYYEPEDGVWCHHCEEMYPEDEIYWVLDNPVCCYCRDEFYTYCDECGEYEVIDYSFWIESAGYYVCEQCFSENYFRCSRCDYNFHDSDAHALAGDLEHTYCPDCFAEVAVECENCDDACHRDDVAEHNGHWYCDDCYKEVLSEELVEA